MTREDAIKGLKVLRKDFSGYKPNEEMFDMAIKSLEQHPSEDCERVLNRVMEYTYGMLTTEKIGLQHLIKTMIDELPPVTPTQSWIPVSERLPDTHEEVLCWYEYYHWSQEKVLPEYGIGYYSKEMEIWCGEVASGVNAKVLAWQPLPKPYEEKRGNEN